MHRILRSASAARWLCALCLLVLALQAQALGNRRGKQLVELQSAYAQAIRWGEFEQAWQLVDPEYRQAHPLTDFVLARYGQVQIAGYRDLGTTSDGRTEAVRLVEIRVINRNTMAERSVRHRERWRYDEAAKRWWVADGLPDLWEGE